jgi:predicted nucleic acid-binding protein
LKRVIDTSAWIEFLVDSATGARVEAEMPRRDACIVPTIVQLELAKWLAREVTEDREEAVLADTAKCLVVPLDTPLALLAVQLSREKRLATADAIIYATALAHDAELITCDAHFKDLPGVIYFPKARP